MTPDWNALGPHRPLDPGSNRYVLPPHGAGEEIAARIAAGTKVVLVGGPAGIGKSTELAHAATVLRDGDHRVACLVPVDLWENMRRLSPEQLLLRIAGRVAFVAAQNLKLPIDPSLLNTLIEEGVLSETVLQREGVGLYQASPLTLATEVLEQVARLSRQRRLTLLIDGMEKVPEGPGSLELFDALAQLPESVELVVVVPWHAAYGAHSETVVRTGEHWTILSPPQVEGDEGGPARDFLREVVARRLGVDSALLHPEAITTRVVAKTLKEFDAPSGFPSLIERAATQSGGIVRTFLQLIADAGTYARLRRNEDWPNDDDLADSVADLEDSFRRALLPGDTERALAAEGTDGRELELERRIRLLSRGVLLERRNDRRVVLEIHPLARRPLTEGSQDA
jgi:hypothetical protein